MLFVFAPVLNHISLVAANFPAPTVLHQFSDTQHAPSFSKYLHIIHYPLEINCIDRLLSSSSSYAAMHARAVTGAGSGNSNMSSRIKTPNDSLQGMHSDADRRSVDADFTKSERATRHTKSCIAFTCAHDRGDAIGSESLDNALRASYDAIAQVAVVFCRCFQF